MKRNRDLAGVQTILAAAAFVVALGAASPLCFGQAADGRPLDIYFLDMDGGASTLIVTPLGESVLIDTGSLGPADRDAKRIVAAARDAGLSHIDLLITTHFHSDHYGGILKVAQLLPVKRFLDKGHLPQARERNSEEFKTLYARYEEATAGKLGSVKAGDDIPLRNDPQGRQPKLTLHCVAAERCIEGFSGDVDAAVPGHEMKPADLEENARSVALVLRYGKFGFFAGGDITWNVEHHLACPKNVVGPVDLYQVTHHGLDVSNNPVLLAALNPTVCIAMNGPGKGIEPPAFDALRHVPSVRAIYQIHYNVRHGARANAPAEFIANGKQSAKGQYIKASVAPDASRFTVTIGKSGSPRTYSVK